EDEAERKPRPHRTRPMQPAPIQAPVIQEALSAPAMTLEELDRKLDQMLETDDLLK
ncbi:MAG: hypothetical protein ACD_63C00261G0008, partial [uncultured bacterium]